MDDCEDGDTDIYNDLPDFRYDETIDKLNAIITKLEAENRDLHSKLAEMKKEKEVLEKNCSVLSTNITSLLKTAKLEIQRKDRTIDDLRQQLRETGRRTHFGVKRHFESTTFKNQSSETKTISKRETQNYEPAYKKQRFSESDNLMNHSLPKSEESTNENPSFLKPLPKATHPSQKENVPLTSCRRISPVEVSNTMPKISAPSLPIIDCPTVFSARMYQRLYNKSVTRTVTPNTLTIPPSGEELPNRVPEETTKVSEQPKRAIICEKTASKTPEEALKQSSNLALPLKSSTTGAIPQNFVLTIAKHNSTFRDSEANSSVNVCVVGKNVNDNNDVHPNVLPAPSDSHVHKTDLGNATDIQLPTVTPRSTRSRSSGIETKKLSLVPKNNGNIASTNDAKLQTSVKGKSGSRKKFAPISNAWNCLKLPTSEVSSKSEQSDSMVKDSKCSEVSCVTTELNVKIDDGKLNERKNVLLDVFGSPVKWADECSSDSVKFDAPRTLDQKNNLFSIFGSSYKNGDSCSSGPSNFVLPPGAYEDSCCTNQPPEKVSPQVAKIPHASLPDSSSKDKSSESTSASDGRDSAKRDISLPPPAQPVWKKNHSVFSPAKDSKTALSLPGISLDDRSSTGICFPFKPMTKYEDSVLGQFDDTAQFVSALAKVETRISPLGTPLKTSDLAESTLDSDTTKITSPINNLTSFKQVFQNKILTSSSTETRAVAENTYSADGDVTNKKPHSSAVPVGDDQISAGPKKSHPIEEKVCDTVEESNANTNLADSPSTLSSSKFIHRSNFSSSSVFTMSSDSLDKPVNILQPRKTPRAVNKISPCFSNGNTRDVKLNRRIAIPDAFITEQEERVLQWQKNHLYETTLKCVSLPKTQSPTKGHAKVHSIDLKSSSPCKPTSKPCSPAKTQIRTVLPCKVLETQSVPHSVTPENSCVGMKSTASIVEPERVADHFTYDTSAMDVNVIRSVASESALPATTTSSWEGMKSTASIVEPERVAGHRTYDSTMVVNMIRSIASKSSLPATTASSRQDVAAHSQPVKDAICSINSEIGAEKPLKNSNAPLKNDIMPVPRCRQGSSKYPSIISQINPKVVQSSISKLRVSSTTPAVVIKKPLVRRDSDFKRSSALKRSGDKARGNFISSVSNSVKVNSERVSDCERTQKDLLRSNCKMIRRKSAPNLDISSPINETRVISKTPTKIYNSPVQQLEKQVDTHSAVPNGRSNSVWTVYPIDLDRPRYIYEVITSSFSNGDPRALPRPDRSIQEGRKALEDNVRTRPAGIPIVHPVEFSADVSVIRTNVEAIVNTTIPATSTSLAWEDMIGKKQLVDTTGVGFGVSGVRQRSTTNRITSPITPTRIPDVRGSGRGDGQKPLDPFRETRSRGRRRSTETPKEPSPPRRPWNEPVNKPGSRKSLKSAPTAEEPTSGACPKVAVNHSSLVLSTTSVTSTVQPKLISRRRRNANFSSVTVVHSDRPVIISRKRPASFSVNNTCN